MIAVSGTFASAPQLQDQTAGCNCCARNDRAAAIPEKFEKKLSIDQKNYPQVWII
jgi:hypothetical protein